MRVMVTGAGGFVGRYTVAELLARGHTVTAVVRPGSGLPEALERPGVDVLRTDDGEAAYRRCPTTEHHHHLVCRSCGRSVEVDGPEVEAWATSVAEQHGFTEVSHTVEVFGTCTACAGSAAAQGS